MTVEGRAFSRGCNDTGSENAFGCQTSETEPETPMEDVVLLLRQGGQEWELGTEDAGSAAEKQQGHITWQAQVPAELERGRAVLIADVAPRGKDGLDTRLPLVIRQPGAD